eukprot:594071-Rhodomonas_salina.2
MSERGSESGERAFGSASASSSSSSREVRKVLAVSSMRGDDSGSRADLRARDIAVILESAHASSDLDVAFRVAESLVYPVVARV